MRNYIAFSARDLITLFYANILLLICSTRLICVLGRSGLDRWATREWPEWPPSSIPSLGRWILHEVITGEIVWVPLQHDVFLCTHSFERAGSGRAPMARLMTACAWEAESYRSRGGSKTVQRRGRGGQTLPESLSSLYWLARLLIQGCWSDLFIYLFLKSSTCAAVITHHLCTPDEKRMPHSLCKTKLNMTLWHLNKQSSSTAEISSSIDLTLKSILLLFWCDRWIFAGQISPHSQCHDVRAKI